MRLPEARDLLVRLSPDAFWTLANNLLSVIGGLAVVKLISSLVAADQYGEASLALGIVALLVQFVVNPLLTAYLRLHFDDPGRDSADFMGRIRPLLTKSAIAMGVAYLLTALMYRWRGHPAYLNLFPEALLLIFLQPRLFATFNFFESQRRYRRLTFAETLSKIAPAGLLALLLLTPLPRSRVVVLAQGLAVGGVYLLYRPRASSGSAQPDRPHGIAVDRPLSPWSEFGGTLYLFNIVSWIMTTSDRYLIEHYRSEREVGLYALNYGFCAMPFLMINAWLEVFTRARLYKRAAEADWGTVRTIILARTAAAGAMTAAGLLLLYSIGEPIALILVGPRYWQGLRLAMFVGAGHAFFVAGSSFHSLFIAAKRVDILLRTALAAAAVNVGLNLWLVPKLGILGAGTSTMVAYVVWCAMLIASGLTLLGSLTSTRRASATVSPP